MIDKIPIEPQPVIPLSPWQMMTTKIESLKYLNRKIEHAENEITAQLTKLADARLLQRDLLKEMGA